MKTIANRRGFSLLEMMFACFVMTIIMAGIFSVMTAVMENDKRSSLESELFAVASRAVERVQRGSDGLSGLMKAREASVTVGAGGGSITFDVDENLPYTTDIADDTAKSVYVLDADGVPGTVEDNQLVMDQDVSTPGNETVLCRGVSDLSFEKDDRMVRMTVELERTVRGQPVRINAQQDIYLRN